MDYSKDKYLWALLRLSLGFIFFWAFMDKLFGLGFATKAENSWLSGGSPTLGFLKFGTTGPLSSFYQSLAGNAVVDWLFMLGLGLVGIALILGIGIKIAGLMGALVMLLIWSAHLPPTNNPFLDEHLVYILILIGLTQVEAGDGFGFGKRWSEAKLVEKFPFLK